MLFSLESFIKTFEKLASKEKLKEEFKKLQEFNSQEYIEMDVVDLEMLIDELTKKEK